MTQEINNDNEINNEEDKDDFVFETEDDTEDITAKLKKLREKLRKCEEEKQEYLNGWQRSKADFVNARKQDEEWKINFIKNSNENLVKELLPVADSFDMAFSNKEAWEKVDKNWRIGVEYIFSQLITVFESHGLKQINPTGEKLDVSKHSPLEVVESDDANDDDKIISVIQKGYELNGKVIRPARVKVAKFKK